jgi:NitT/TauT family transport system substrate-binding protein
VPPTATEEILPTAAPTDTPAPEPITLRVALFPYSSYAPFYFAEAEGFFAEQGITIEWVDFTRQTEAVAALASGQIDAGGGVLDAGSMSAIGQGTGLMIVADKGYVDPEAACPYGAWMIRKDLYESGELNDLKNLKGRKVVVPKTGFFEYAMDQLLAPVGLSVSDLEVVDMPGPARLEALTTGAVDVAQMGEPWITRALASGEAVVWYPFEETQPNAQYAVVWFGPTLTKENPEAGRRFMVAYMKGVQQYNQGKTERNVALMAELIKSTPEDAGASCWQAFTADGHVNLDFISDFQEWALAKDYIDRVVPVEEFWDGSYLEYALQVLGQ